MRILKVDLGTFYVYFLKFVKNVCYTYTKFVKVKK